MDAPADNCLPINREALPDVDLDEPFRNAQRKHGFDLTSAYNIAAKQASEKGADKVADTYRSIGILCSFHPNFDNITKPYTPAIIMEGKRSAVPDDLSEVDLDTVAALRLKTKEPLLRARMGDILWIRRNDHVAAKEASADYLSAASANISEKGWIWVVELFQRALQLGHWLGRKSSAWLAAEAATVEALNNPVAKTQPFYAANFLNILIQMQAGDAVNLAKLASQHAEKALTDKQPSRGRDYRQYEAQLWHRAGEETKEAIARLEAAKTYELEADQWVAGEKPGYFAASGSLTQGIEALRQAHGDPEHIEELRKKLMLYQRESLKEMQTLEHSIDISGAVKQTIERVTVSDFREALKLLAFSVPLVNRKELRETVLKEASENVWQNIVATSLIDDSGRITKHLGTAWDEEAKREANIEDRMFRHASDIDWQTRAIAFIEPARRQIWSQHLPRERDLTFLVTDNTFVPPGHEGIFRRGLHYGLQGDLLLATHLLAPQVENSIRYVLEQRGVDISNLQSDLTQPVKLLGPLLDLPETRQIFGDNLWFEFRGILIEKTGYSFRNRVAHGFLVESECYGSEALNLWWLVLRVCYTPLVLNRTQDAEKPKPSPT
jgi:Domain of unknown function (DUF4209)